MLILSKMAIDGYIINLDYSDIKQITAEIQKMSNSFNQIAKRVNSSDSIYKGDIEDIKAMLK